ncbi:MAG TPA: glycosyltransferase family 4 protein [Vitreimonas sp.]|uniref:glycosyltransferase family 4 protein n=1 Tax=Vitreimonas sp. TaxID=3069702 RepID=UPI002D6A4A8A|nr:glycosyltransferase family 4 protein [Vitreimonas sp.]HYD88106.1 glycosyltransferase family 4 protein [Vitreimonas sp.]
MIPHRVLMTVDAVGGVWTYAAELAAQLRMREIEVVLAVVGPAPSAAQMRAMRGTDVRVTGLPLDWLADDADEVRRSASEVVALARSVDADLVHLNSPTLAGFAEFDAPVVGACHSCLASWWRDVRGGEMPAEFRMRTEWLARGYRACRVLMAPSAAFAASTFSLYGVRPHVVLNGRGNRGRIADSRKQRVALTAGRLWDDGKNFGALDKAAARMRYPLVAAGPLVGANGTLVSPRNARALGPLSEAKLDRWMNRAAVFVSIARYEPFGLCVLEAAQAGCALVLSDIPSFRELWSGAAMFVPLDDDEAVSRAVNLLIENEAVRSGCVARSVELARRYRPEAMADGMLAVYAAAGSAKACAVA